MSRKEDETIYIRKNGKYKAIGRLYDKDFVGYGSYFVTNKKYSRGLHWIGAAPNPDFIELETAVEESRDELRVAFREIVNNFVHSDDYFKYDYEAVDKVVQAIRDTFLKKKKSLLEKLNGKDSGI